MLNSLATKLDDYHHRNNLPIICMPHYEHLRIFCMLDSSKENRRCRLQKNALHTKSDSKCHLLNYFHQICISTRKL
jgi:hypothetical protein